MSEEKEEEEDMSEEEEAPGEALAQLGWYLVPPPSPLLLAQLSCWLFG